MQSFHELSFSEQRRIRDLIDVAVAEANAAGYVAVLPVPRRPVIADLLGDYRYPAPAWLDAAQAEAAITDLTRALLEAGLRLRGAEWLGPREYYAWMVDQLLAYPLPANVDPEHPTELRFVDLMPDSVDGLFWTVDAFVRQLFGLARPPAPALLDDGARQALVRYLPAWQAAFLGTHLRELRPTAVHDVRETVFRSVSAGSGPSAFPNGGGKSGRTRINEHFHVGSDNQAWLDFKIQYSVRYENHATASFSGEGRAELARSGARWSIQRISFPGFDAGLE